MLTLSLSETKEFVRHVALRMREPAMIWGQPGVGKSQGMAQLAKEENAFLIDIRLSQYDSVDLRGIPDTITLGELNDPNAFKMTRWCQPSTMPFKGNPNFEQYKDQIILLFLDEMNSASLSTLAVAYQLVNDRRVGEHELMDNVVVVAAGNREGDRGVTNKMPLPLANRFTHVETGVDVDGWCLYIQEIGLPAIGAAFIQFRKPLLSQFDELKNKPVKAIATPRTWEKALRYYADAQMPEHIKHAATAGAVGAGASDEFWGFTKVWQQVGGLMKEIVKNPKTAPLPDEASMSYAVAVSISGSMNLKTTPAYQQYLERMPSEFLILAWQLATRRDQSVLNTKEFITVARTHASIFQG